MGEVQTKPSEGIWMATGTGVISISPTVHPLLVVCECNEPGTKIYNDHRFSGGLLIIGNPRWFLLNQI